MIVRQFLQWVRTASAGERAEATSALARAYLYSELSSDDRSAAEGAMLMLLDDASPLVRRALAEALAASANAPPAVIHALAADQPEIAALVIDRSPLFIDADLVDLAATGGPDVQTAIARRAPLPRVGRRRARRGRLCRGLPDPARQSVRRHRRLLDRPHRRPFRPCRRGARASCSRRADLPSATRQALVAKLSATLADFVVSRDWLDAGRARRAAAEACEKATVTLAAESPADDVRPLVKHLRATGQLTAGLVLRALLSGNMRMFEEALAELADLPLARVRALLHDRGMTGLRAIFDQAGLPASTWPAFREAIVAMREGGPSRRAGRGIAAEAAHDRARADRLREGRRRRRRAAADAAAPLRHRGGARRSPALLRGTGRGRFADPLDERVAA